MRRSYRDRCEGNEGGSLPLHRVGGGVIALALALQVASSLFVNAVVFQDPVIGWLQGLRRVTGGLVVPNLVANLVPMGLVVGGAMFLAGRLRPRDVGWTRASLPVALGGTFAFWVALQAAAAAALLQAGRPLMLASSWTDPGSGSMIGELLGQVLGNALAEETFFCAFLFHALCGTLLEWWGPRAAGCAAALGSQAVFALAHLPNRLLVKGMPADQLAADQVRLLVMGLLFLALYLATRNLLFVVGVHALFNRPVLLFDAPRDLVLLVLLLGLVAVVGFRSLWRVRAGPGESS